MSKIYKCDRCGAVFETRRLDNDQVVAAVICYNWSAEIKLEWESWGQEQKRTVECGAKLVDLCPKCLDEFEEWFNGHAGEEKEPEVIEP